MCLNQSPTEHLSCVAHDSKVPRCLPGQFGRRQCLYSGGQCEDAAGKGKDT